MGVWAERVSAELSMEEAVGQLVLSDVGAKREQVMDLVAEGRVGALIFYGKDMTDPISVARLANEFQGRAKVPLLIAADFEAGTGFILRGGTAFPSNMALGATGDLKLARQCGAVTAKEARALGIHWIFAPVVDVNVNPENPIINIRSFGGDPDEVSRLAVAWIDGCQGNKCLATAKHFPGHGDTKEDSHRVMPVVPHDMERMESVELKPFRTAIEAGVQSIMTAHIHFPALDPTPGLPATLSFKILTGLLRERMGFQGIIVTDAMAMWAIKHNFDPKEAAVMAVGAGADVVLADDPILTYEALLKAVREGRLSGERVREAAHRVLRAKEWCGLHRERFTDEGRAGEVVGCPQHQELAHQVAQRAVTLRGKGVPLPRDAPILAVVTESQRWTGEKPSEGVKNYLQKTFLRIEVHHVSPQPTPDQLEAIRRRLREKAYQRALLCLFPRAEAYRPESAGVGENLVTLGQTLASRLPLIVVSFGSPYPLLRFPMAQGHLCTYSDCPASLRAGVDVLSGTSKPSGKSPVPLPG